MRYPIRLIYRGFHHPFGDGTLYVQAETDLYTARRLVR
jgi:hypothetical protein